MSGAADFTKHTVGDDTWSHIADLLEGPSRKYRGDRKSFLAALIQYYDRTGDVDEARDARLAFLTLVSQEPGLLSDETFARFLVDEIEVEDVERLEWKSAEEVIRYCETIYKLNFDDVQLIEQLTGHSEDVVRHTLFCFERDRRYDHMWHLLRIAPLPSVLKDPRLHRLYNRSYLFTMRRSQRRRRLLHGYLVIQALLILVIFPFLFIYAENGAIQRQLEETAKVELPEDPQIQFLSYADGLYWSVITAGSIGYGDITPVTRVGKIIAGVLGTIGVVTIGVFAGLILDWIRPQQFQ